MAHSYTMSPAVAERLAKAQPLLINGRWTASEDGSVSEVYNPSSGEVITTAAMATRADTERAVAAARASFDGGAWTVPDGFVNFSDVSATIKKFQQNAQAVHVIVADLDPQWPNFTINFNDISMVVSGFQEVAYPVGAGDFQTIGDCPLGTAP